MSRAHVICMHPLLCQQLRRAVLRDEPQPGGARERALSCCAASRFRGRRRPLIMTSPWPLHGEGCSADEHEADDIIGSAARELRTRARFAADGEISGCVDETYMLKS